MKIFTGRIFSEFSLVVVVAMFIVGISQAKHCSIFDQLESKKCTKYCCGDWEHSFCHETCDGFSCRTDSECGSGCCNEGKCHKNCAPVRLIIGVTITFVVTLTLLVVLMLLRCYLRKKNPPQTNNVACSHFVDMGEPYWRVRTLNSTTPRPSMQISSSPRPSIQISSSPRPSIQTSTSTTETDCDVEKPSSESWFFYGRINAYNTKLICIDKACLLRYKSLISSLISLKGRDG